MYKHCNTEEGALRQRQIENCLMDLMLTVPYSQITVGDICEKAGLSRKSFYRYFGSKEGCLHGLIDHCILDSHRAYHADPISADDQAKVLECYFIYWQQNNPLLEALCRNEMANRLLERSMLCVTQEELEFRNFLNADNQDDAFEQALFIVSGITGLIIHWHMSGYQKSAAQMASVTGRLLAKKLMPLSAEKS